jgi:hypothetical protein
MVNYKRGIQKDLSIFRIRLDFSKGPLPPELLEYAVYQPVMKVFTWCVSWAPQFKMGTGFRNLVNN